MHKLTRSLLLTGALALGGLAGCGDDVSVVQPPPPEDGVTGISISPIDVTLEVGETAVFTASVQTTGSAVNTATFSSSNTSVATIDATSGSVTAVAPGATTITATADADANQKSSTQLTVNPVDVDIAATVSIQSITTGVLDTPVNIANTFGQIDVSINLEANDEVVSTLDLLVDGVVVAQQTYSAAQAAVVSEGETAEAADVIVLSFRTDAFDPATGVASFLNGQHEINAVANVPDAGVGTQRASNSITLNFNNNDAFYVEIDNTPTNTPAVKSAISALSVEWRQGDVSLTSIPVVYTPTVANGDTPKTVCTRTVSWAGAGVTAVGTAAACLSGPQTTVIDLTPGYQTVAALPQITDLPRVPAATFTDGSAMLYNQNAIAINSVNGVTNVSLARFPAPPAGSSNIGLAAGVSINGFNMDNLAPAGVALTLPPLPEDRWVNASFDWAATATTRGVDGGVGLGLASADIYEFAASDDGYTALTSFTATTNDIPEHAADFTRDAYSAQVTVVDLLNNGATVVVNGTAAEGDHFGVDITPPTISYMGTDTTSAVNPSFMKYSVDSILNDVVVNDQLLTSATAMFGVLIRDTRSGFNTVVGSEPLFRRIQYTNPAGDICAEGVVVAGECTFFQLLPPIEITDPTFRVDSLNIFGTAATATATTPGYLYYESYVVDRAGNVSDTATKSAAVDVTAPQVTGLQIPAILTGGSQLSWVPTGLDDLEVLSGQLYLNYPNVGQLAFGPTTVGFNTPFNCVWSPLLTCTFGTPVGPGAPFGSAGIASPIGFLRSVSQVTPADSAPPLAIAPADKPDFVSAQLYDIKRGEASLGGASPDSSGLINVPLLAGLIDPGVLFSTVGVGKWFVFTSGTTGSTFQARALTATTISNPPFPQVSFYRFNVANSQWDFLGVVTASAPTNPTLFDQGADRFWTYSLNNVTPSLATGDNIMAIGMSAAGDGLATVNFIVP